MEEAEALLAQSRLLTVGKAVRRSLDEVSNSSDVLLAALQNAGRDLAQAHERIADLEAENARLLARLGPKGIAVEQQSSLLGELVTLREMVVREHEERVKLALETEALKQSNVNMELQLAQLSPTRLAKKGKAARPSTGEENKSYKSLYQKRRQQSTDTSGCDTPRFS
jgi:hypothetical protein